MREVGSSLPAVSAYSATMRGDIRAIGDRSPQRPRPVAVTGCALVRHAPELVREVATVTETSETIAGVQVRWVSVLLEGHTVEQVLSYDVAEAEAVFGRPFDDEMDSEMRSAMYSADRIWLGETMWKVASAASYVLDGKCIRTAKIEHCDEIRGCIPGAAAISHQELTSP